VAASRSRDSHWRASHARKTAPSATPSGETIWRSEYSLTANRNVSSGTICISPATTIDTAPAKATGSGLFPWDTSLVILIARKTPVNPTTRAPGCHVHM